MPFLIQKLDQPEYYNPFYQASKITLQRISNANLSMPSALSETTMISDFLERLFGSREPVSRDTAKQRLRLVLAHDRSDLSPQNLEKLRQEILEVVSRYVELDLDGLEFSLESDQRMTALMANLPIRRVRSNPLEPDRPVEENETSNLELADESINLDEGVEEVSETADIPLD